MYEKFIERSRREAEKSVEYRYKHGAVIFDKHGNELSVGRNKQKFVPSLRKYGYRRCWLHAESDAILKCEDSRGHSLLVVRACKTKLGNSKPCSCCLALIKEVGIKHVFYSNSESRIEHIRL